MSFASNEFFDTFRKIAPVPTVCPCHYRATCVVTKLRVVSMLRDLVLLVACVVRNHDLIRTTFGSQFTRALSKLGTDIMMALAVDWSQECVEAYCRSFGAFLVGADLRLDDDLVELPESMVVQADLSDFGWLHLTGIATFDIGVCSPSCPPWSFASSVLGLNRIDGALTAMAWGLLSLLGCKVAAIETVGGMAPHNQWGLLQSCIQSWSWQIRYCKTLDLGQHLSQKRDGFLVLAVKCEDVSIFTHCVSSWPSGTTPLIQEADIIMDVHGHWLDECIITEDLLKIYMDPSNLPKGKLGAKTLKKACRFVCLTVLFLSIMVTLLKMACLIAAKLG